VFGYTGSTKKSLSIMKQKIEIHCGLMRGETSLILCVKQDIGGEAARTSLLVQLAPLSSLQVKPIVVGESGGILESGQWLIFGLISRLVDMLEFDSGPSKRCIL
jgi:hypothetical protein